MTTKNDSDVIDMLNFVSAHNYDLLLLNSFEFLLCLNRISSLAMVLTGMGQFHSLILERLLYQIYVVH